MFTDSPHSALAMMCVETQARHASWPQQGSTRRTATAACDDDDDDDDEEGGADCRLNSCSHKPH
jgi:hypothetical protein